MTELIAYVYGSTDKDGEFRIGGSQFLQVAGPAATLSALRTEIERSGWYLPVNIGILTDDKVKALDSEELTALG